MIDNTANQWFQIQPNRFYVTICFMFFQVIDNLCVKYEILVNSYQRQTGTIDEFFTNALLIVQPEYAIFVPTGKAKNKIYVEGKKNLLVINNSLLLLLFLHNVSEQ
jgi:hypothetical protein